MRIITMKRLTEGGEPLVDDELTQCDPNDWFCVIETKEEELVYDKAHTEGEYAIYEKIWDSMVIHAGIPQGLAWGEDDIYGYFTPDEVVPEVGEEWTDGDNDKWVRVE